MTKKAGQTGWEELFASPTLGRLLAKFLTHPDTPFYQRELLDAAQAQLYDMQQALGRPERAQLVTKRPAGIGSTTKRTARIRLSRICGGSS